MITPKRQHERLAKPVQERLLLQTGQLLVRASMSPKLHALLGAAADLQTHPSLHHRSPHPGWRRLTATSGLIGLAAVSPRVLGLYSVLLCSSRLAFGKWKHVRRVIAW